MKRKELIDFLSDCSKLDDVAGEPSWIKRRAKELLASLSSNAKDEGEKGSVKYEEDKMTIFNLLRAEHVGHSKAWFLTRSLLDLINKPTPPPSLSAECVETIINLTQCEIPYYAYGDNEAACDMAQRLNQIGELARLLLQDYARTVGDRPTVKEDLTVTDECQHPYAYIYRKGDYEKCTKCDKELCNG